MLMAGQRIIRTRTGKSNSVAYGLKYSLGRSTSSDLPQDKFFEIVHGISLTLSSLYRLIRTNINRSLWFYSATELHRLSDLLGRLVSNFRVELVPCLVQRIPTVVNLCFLEQSPYIFIQIAPRLSSRGWVDTIPDTIASQKIWQCRESIPGPSDLITRLEN
jgi:hypothetical protein